jgi:rfaE bifunctional protein kinase chain/domain
MSSKIIYFQDDFAPAKNQIALCYGHFTSIHPGHIRYLEYAKSTGLPLWVAVKGNGEFVDRVEKNRYSILDRCEGVAALHLVDGVLAMEDKTLSEAVAFLQPKFLILGKEFEDERGIEVRDAVGMAKLLGCEVRYHSGTTHYESAQLLYGNSNDLNLEKLRAFGVACQKNNINTNDLIRKVESFSKVNVMVLGDVIVDRYIACDALGMSAEAPVIVVGELESRDFMGGAAIVAAHVASLGAQCHLISVVGDDLCAEFLETNLVKMNIKYDLVRDSTRPTTLKTRYMVGTQKVFRVSKLKDHNLPKDIENRIIEKIKNIAGSVNGILISDFVYGVISKSILEVIESVSSHYNIPVFGDLQCSSQIGDVSKFKNFKLIFPTEREARISLGSKDSGIEWVANQLIDKTNSNGIIMKLGPDGFIVYESRNTIDKKRQHFPALVSNPLDVSGAGDSLFAAVSVAVSSGADTISAAAIGCCTAALAVQTVGNNPISKKALKDYINKMA